MSEVTELQRADPIGIRRVLRSMAWWALTMAVLVVLDDLTFGPAFWAISRWAGAAAAVAAVFATYVPVQIYLVRRATEPEPGRFARFFLDRLELQRRSPEVARREARVHSQVLGVTSAVLLTPLIGGVLPPLLLWRVGHPTRLVRRLSYLTAPLYAMEFAVLHGVLPSLI